MGVVVGTGAPQLFLDLVVLVQLGDDVVDQTQQLLDDALLAVGHLTRHLVDAGAGVRVDLGGDSLAAAHMLVLEVLEAGLALRPETLDLIGGLVLGLFQATRLAWK